MLTYQEKLSVLKKEFQELDIKHDQSIRKEDIFAFLDYKCGFEFDREICYQFLDYIEKNFNNIMTIDTFIQTYLEAEKVLFEKVQKSQEYLDEFYKQKKEATMKYELVKQTEQLNQFGIMKGNQIQEIQFEDSSLTINILELTQVQEQHQNKLKSFIVIECGKTKIQSRKAQIQNSKIVWNEQFTIPIETGQEEILITVLQSENLNDNFNLGQIEIKIGELKDQYKHEKKYTFENSLQENWELKLNLQWIHSKVLYFAEVLQRWQDNLKTQEEDLAEFKRDLKTIYQPFPNLQYRKTTENYDLISPIDCPQINYELTPIPYLKTLPQHPRQESDNFHEVYNLVRYLVGALILLELLGFFERALFLDSLIFMAFSNLYLQKQLDATKLKFLAVAGFISFVLDLPFIIIYAGVQNLLNFFVFVFEKDQPWWDEEATEKMVSTVSFLIFFLKLGFVCTCGYLSGEWKESLSPYIDRPSSSLGAHFSPSKPSIYVFPVQNDYKQFQL